MSQKKPRPKKKSRKWAWVLIIALLMVGGWYSYHSLLGSPRINPLNLIPSDAIFILETDRPYDVWTELNTTELWKILQKDEEWREHGEKLASLESTLSDFDRALNLLTNRTFYLSAHPYRKNKLDYLFVLDMEGLAALRTWLTRGDYVTKRQFEGKTIYEQFHPESKETFYFSFQNNFLVASSTHTLVEASLIEQAEASLNRSFDFIDVRKQVIGEGLVRLYLNYNSLFAHLQSRIGREDTEIIRKQLPFLFSGFYFDVQEEVIFLEGYSNYIDSVFTYLHLLTDVGEGNLDIASVAPSETSVLFSLGFDSFTKFHKKLSKRLKEDEEVGEDYESYIRKTEKFLDINIEKDLIEWVDDEVALIQIESKSFTSETAFIIKAKKASLAKEKMEFLNRQVRKKTPVRFKAVTYRDYTINFMSVKGLFNLILGNLFKKFDRPYYTIIDEYVIFSSQPNVLRSIIDGWISKNTLDKMPAFQKFKRELGEDHCALLYLQPPLLERTNTSLLDDGAIQLIKSKQGLLSHFPQSAFKINSAGNFFKTKSLLSILPVERKTIPSPEVTTYTINYDSIWQIDPGDQIEVGEIEIVDLGAKKQSESFEKGLPKYEVDIKNGQKHGNYFEYHETGELKIKGKYKNDLKDGLWKYYDIDGKLVNREKYKQGQLID